MRKLSYDKLWRLLAAKNMTKKNLRLKAGLSSVSVAKLGKGESVGTGILLRICDVLDCELCDILDTFEESGEEYSEQKPKTYKIVDLFAGVGGLSYGFAHRPEFEIVLANDHDADIAKAYSLNYPDTNMIVGDIRDLDEETIFRSIDSDVDVIIGGPPCQSYSTLGKRRMDARAHLFEEYCRVLSIVKPKIFIFENVTGLLSMQGGALLLRIIKQFAAHGYSVKCRVLNAADYGVPQIRERAFLVGTRGENTFEYPAPTHGDGLLPYLTLSDAFGDLPVLACGSSGTEYATPPQNDYQRYLRQNDPPLTEDDAPRNGEHLVRIMQALPDGGDKKDLPEELRPSSGYANTYAKLWWDRPATTVTRNFATPSSSRCIHPRDSRAMTTREGARLQSFPDDYKFYGSVGKKHLEIGNAVPPLLSVRLAEEVLRFLNNDSEH